MIDPKELRIGNLVYLKYLRSAPDEWCQDIDFSGIDGITKVKASVANHFFKTDEFNPIPITPEWLEQLGFAKDEMFDPPSDRMIYCLDMQNGNTISEAEALVINEGMAMIRQVFGKDVITCVLPTNIKYVHQLQNIYFALTGKELQTK